MNTRKARVSFPWLTAIAVGLLAELAPPLRAEDGHRNAPCSVAMLRGSYGFYRSGTGAFGGPLAAVGVQVYDGAGNGSVIQSTSRGGEISLDESFSFTYTIAPDCSGKGFRDDGTEFVRSVVVDDGKTFYFFSESPGNTIYGVATRIHD